ncbi:MAG: OB-fold domain-containing protein [Sphingobium sp.]
MNAPRSPQRPRPRLDATNRPFWTGGAEGRLNITKCHDCSQFTHPPRQFCRHCQSENVEPHAVAGTGVIDTMTVNHQPWLPGLDVPFVIARVKLDDAPGVYLTTNIVGSPVDQVDIDDQVRVTFEEQDGIWFPLFEKVA